MSDARRIELKCRRISQLVNIHDPTNPCPSNFSILAFSVTVRTTLSGAPYGRRVDLQRHLYRGACDSALATSQTMTVLSAEPAANCVPSGLQATPPKALVCPVSVACGFPLATSHTMIVWSTE